MDTEFQRALRYVPDRAAGLLTRLPARLTGQVHEIRLRAGAPLILSAPGQEWMITSGGRETAVLSSDVIAVSAQELEECFYKMCEYSVHSHQHELCRGFITTANGCRVGVAGTAVTDGAGAGGKITSVRRISSLCIRVARIHDGCAADLAGHVVSRGGIRGTLICGPPSSGKTSLLRDLARRLAEGGEGRRFRVAVADERGELSMSDRLSGCDVLRGYPKAEGIQQAIRCLAPDVVIFDELGGSDEVAAVLEGLNSGVSAVATVHAADSLTLLRRRQAYDALVSGAFEQVAFIAGRERPGCIDRIVETGDLLAENNRTDACSCFRGGSGSIRRLDTVPESGGAGGRCTAG